MIWTAFIFDVDGTVAETEELHRKAFNAAFRDFNLGWNWSRTTYRELLKVTGGKERIKHFASKVGQTVDEIALHRQKTEWYVSLMSAGQIELRPGVERLINYAHKSGIKLAIATTTSRANVEALFAATLGLDVLSWFDVIACGEDVLNKKPDPEVYKLVLEKLSVQTGSCVAFEDSQNGIIAAKGADLHVVATPAIYTSGDDFSKADIVTSDLENYASVVIQSSKSD